MVALTHPGAARARGHNAALGVVLTNEQQEHIMLREPNPAGQSFRSPAGNGLRSTSLGCTVTISAGCESHSQDNRVRGRPFS